MQAVRFYGADDIRLENIAIPEIEPDEVLVKVAYAGICGSDLHIYNKGMFIDNPPQTMGHEFSGVIETVGSDVECLKIGDKVVGDPKVSCGLCELCLSGKSNLCPDLGFLGEVAPGSFAEYMPVKSEKILLIPKEVSLLEAALAEPLAVAIHTSKKGDFSSKSNIGIIGAGTIGVITALLAQDYYKVNNTYLVDVSQDRLKLACENGVQNVIKKYDLCDAADIVVEAAGSGFALADALDWVKPEGKVVIAGIYEETIDFDPNVIVAKELNVTGIHGYHYQDISAALRILAEKSIDLSNIFKVTSMEKAQEVFKSLREEKKVLKVLLSPSK